MPKQPRNKNIVRQIRERLGLSRQALADRLGFSRRKVQQIEAGKQALDDETADSLRDYGGVVIPRDEDETSGEKGCWAVESESEEDFEDEDIDEQEEESLNTRDRENLNTLADAARGILRLIGLAALRKNVHVHFGRALERYLIRVITREKLKPLIAAVLREEYRK